MEKPVLIYCYDAYCGWCYGFSPVIKKIAAAFAAQADTEVLSGGMILTDTPRHIGATATYIQQAYKRVEEYTGIQFGSDYLWHIHHPEESDWYPSSEKPSIALCIFKEYFPQLQVELAAALQYALHYEGRDLCDDEAYRPLLQQYGINENEFYSKLKNLIYKEQAYYEFECCRQLQVKAFPAVLLRVSDVKFHLLAQGYMHYEALAAAVTQALRHV